MDGGAPQVYGSCIKLENFQGHFNRDKLFGRPDSIEHFFECKEFLEEKKTVKFVAMKSKGAS